MREDNTEHADVQHLLGDPLVHLAAVGRDPHQGRHLGGQRPALHDLAPVPLGVRGEDYAQARLSTTVS
jgi:hypothetical protein